MGFKRDFIWGVATASYQIEGAFNKDGKGLNIWDDFTHTEGKISDGSNGDVACDFYDKYEKDIELMAELGVNAFRFSISWSRIMPSGRGKVNRKGIDFYNKVIDLLLKKNIVPFITLYHWDMPSEIYKNGGFKSDEIVDCFCEYTKLVCDCFGDRVKNFITFNEPFSFISNGYVKGIHAPGEKVDVKTTLQIIHRMLLCHGNAVKIIRENVEGAKVSIATSSWAACPISEDAYDLAKKDYFSINRESPSECVSIYLDPIIFGDYPKEYYDYFGDILPFKDKNDLKIISQPIDSCCHNIYTGYKMDGNGIKTNAPTYYGAPLTSVGWEFMPESIYYGSKMLYERYGLPIVITENGMSMIDLVNKNGQVRDFPRIDYISEYLKELRRASEEGIEVDGYFMWSYCDNFEWAEGYNPRFGLVYIDYATQKRTPKESFYWYKGVIKDNGENL